MTNLQNKKPVSSSFCALKNLKLESPLHCNQRMNMIYV